MLEHKFSFSTNNEEIIQTFDADFGEWQHFCVVYSTSIKIVKTIPGELDKLKESFSVNELKISDTSRLTATVGEDFPSEMGPSIIIGILADVRLYLSALSDAEIIEIANFNNISKEFYSLLDSDANLNASIPFIYISKHYILASRSHDDFLWYFEDKFQCQSAISFCKKFNGSIPNLNTVDLEALKSYLVFHGSICTFWMLDNDENCNKAYYSKITKNVTMQVINDTRLAVICVIPKQQKFYFKDDSQELVFLPEPFATLNFYNSDESLFLYYNNCNRFYAYKILYDFLTRVSSYVQITNVIGRYNWTYIDNGNTTTRAIFSVCNSGHFTCTNGDCILMNYVCNYQNDCEDNSDEENCEPGIIPKGFYRTDLPPENYTTIALSLNLDRVLNINLEENTIKMCLTLRAEWYDQRLYFKYLRYQFEEDIKSDIAEIYWSPRIFTNPVLSNDSNAFYLDSNLGDVLAELQVEERKTEVFYGYEGKYVLINCVFHMI